MSEPPSWAGGEVEVQRALALMGLHDGIPAFDMCPTLHCPTGTKPSVMRGAYGRRE